MENQPPTQTPPSEATPPLPAPRRSAPAILTAVIAVLVIGGLAWAATRKSSEPLPDVPLYADEESSKAGMAPGDTTPPAMEPSSVAPPVMAPASAAPTPTTPPPAPVAPKPSAPSTGNRPGTGGLTASRTVVTFYQDWIVFRGSAMKAAYYEGSPYLTSALKDRLRAHSDASVDPVVCAPKDPPRFQVVTITAKGETASADLREGYDSGEVRVVVGLVRESGTWLIDTIDCSTSSR